MEYEVRDGKIFLTRTPEEKSPLLNRLSRIEGQVRGLRQMLEDNRYCMDEVLQAQAIAAAVREFTLLIIGEHLTAAVDQAAKSQDIATSIEDMMAVLRAALRQG